MKWTGITSRCKIGDFAAIWRRSEVNRHQHCIGDTMLMRSPGGASIVVNAGFSVGDTEPGESKANKMYEPWRGSGVIMTVQTNSLPQPNPSRVRYRGSSLWVTGLSLSEAEPGVYHNCSPSRTAHMCRISETAHVQVHSTDSLHRFTTHIYHHNHAPPGRVTLLCLRHDRAFTFAPQVHLGCRGMPRHYRLWNPGLLGWVIWIFGALGHLGWCRGGY